MLKQCFKQKCLTQEDKESYPRGNMLAHLIKQVSSRVESKKGKYDIHFPQKPYNISSAVIYTSTPLFLCTEITEIIV